MARKIVIPAAADAWAYPYTKQLEGAFAPATPNGPTKLDIEDGTITPGKYVMMPLPPRQQVGGTAVQYIEVDTLEEAETFAGDYFVAGINVTWTFALPNPSNHTGASTALRLTLSSSETRVDSRFALLPRMFLLYSDGSEWCLMDGLTFPSSPWATMSDAGFYKSCFQWWQGKDRVYPLDLGDSPDPK